MKRNTQHGHPTLPDAAGGLVKLPVESFGVQALVPTERDSMIYYHNAMRCFVRDVRGFVVEGVVEAR
jgi:hypothetical protein